MRVTALCLSRGDQGMLDAAYAMWRAQSFQGFEFLTVHDGTRPLRVPETEVIDTSPNLGRRRNVGWRAASGDVIAIWDDDDPSDRDRLSVQCGALTRGYEVTTLRHVLLKDGEREERCSMLFGWPQTIVARKSAFEAVGGYPEDQEFDGDMEFTLELFGRHRSIALPGLLYTYCRHGRNVTSEQHWEGLWKMAKDSPKVCDDYI